MAKAPQTWAQGRMWVVLVALLASRAAGSQEYWSVGQVAGGVGRTAVGFDDDQLYFSAFGNQLVPWCNGTHLLAEGGARRFKVVEANRSLTHVAGSGRDPLTMPTVGNIRRDPLQVDIGEIMALTSHVEATRCSAYFTERGTGSIRRLLAETDGSYAVTTILNTQSRGTSPVRSCEYEVAGMPRPEEIKQCNLTTFVSDDPFPDGPVHAKATEGLGALFTTPTALLYDDELPGLFFFDGPALRAVNLIEGRGAKQTAGILQTVGGSGSSGWEDPLKVLQGWANTTTTEYRPLDSSHGDGPRITPFVGFSLVWGGEHEILFLDPLAGLLRRASISWSTDVELLSLSSLDTLIGDPSAPGARVQHARWHQRKYQGQPDLDTDTYKYTKEDLGAAALLREPNGPAITDGVGAAGSMGFARYMLKLGSSTPAETRLLVSGANTAMLTAQHVMLGAAAASFFEEHPMMTLQDQNVGHQLMAHLRYAKVVSDPAACSVHTLYGRGTTDGSSMATAGDVPFEVDGIQVPSAHVVGMSAGGQNSSEVLFATVGAEVVLVPNQYATADRQGTEGESQVTSSMTLNRRSTTRTENVFTSSLGRSMAPVTYFARRALAGSTSEPSSTSSSSDSDAEDAAARLLSSSTSAARWFARTFMRNPVTERSRLIESPYAGAYDVRRDFLTQQEWRTLAKDTMVPLFLNPGGQLNFLGNVADTTADLQVAFPTGGAEVAARLMEWRERGEGDVWHARSVTADPALTAGDGAPDYSVSERDRSRPAVISFKGFLMVIGGNSFPQARLFRPSHVFHNRQAFVEERPPLSGSQGQGQGQGSLELGTDADAFRVEGESTASVLVFNPETNTWKSGQPLNTPREDAAVVEADGLLYLIGGVRRVLEGGNSASSTDPLRYETYGVNTIEVLSDPFGEWDNTTLPVMPFFRDRMGAAYSNGNIYLVGGRKQCPPLDGPMRPETPMQALRENRTRPAGLGDLDLYGQSWQRAFGQTAAQGGDPGLSRRLLADLSPASSQLSSSTSSASTSAWASAETTFEAVSAVADKSGSDHVALAAWEAHADLLAAGKLGLQQQGERAASAIRQAVGQVGDYLAAAEGAAAVLLEGSPRQRGLSSTPTFVVINASSVFTGTTTSSLYSSPAQGQCVAFGGEVTALNLHCLVLSNTLLPLPVGGTAKLTRLEEGTDPGSRLPLFQEEGGESAVDFKQSQENPQSRGEVWTQGGFWTQDDWATEPPQFTDIWFVKQWFSTANSDWRVGMQLPTNPTDVDASAPAASNVQLPQASIAPLPGGSSATGGGGDTAAPVVPQPIYTRGGFNCLDDSRDRPYTSVDVLDILTGAWRQHRSRLKVPLVRPAVAAVGGQIYATGGVRALMNMPDRVSVVANDAVSAVQVMDAWAGGEWRVDNLQYPTELFDSVGVLRSDVTENVLKAQLDQGVFHTFGEVSAGYAGSSHAPRISMVPMLGKLFTAWEVYDLTLPESQRKWQPTSQRAFEGFSSYVHLAAVRGKIFAVSEFPVTRHGGRREIPQSWRNDWFETLAVFEPRLPATVVVEGVLFQRSPAGSSQTNEVTFTVDQTRLPSGSFSSEDVSVSVGGQPATLLSFANASRPTYHATVLFPPGVGENLDVKVTITTQFDTYAGSAPLFSYEPPEITQHLPSTGPTSGGFLVTLRGRNFGPANAATRGKLLVHWERIDHPRCRLLKPTNSSLLVHVDDTELRVPMPPGVGYGWIPRVTAGGQLDITGTQHYEANFYQPRTWGSLQSPRNARPAYNFSYNPPELTSLRFEGGGNPAVGGATLRIMGLNLGYVNQTTGKVADFCGYQPSSPSDRFSLRDPKVSPTALVELPSMGPDAVHLAHPAFKRRFCAGGVQAGILNQRGVLVDALPPSERRDPTKFKVVLRCLLPAGVGGNWTVSLQVDGQKDTRFDATGTDVAPPASRSFSYDPPEVYVSIPFQGLQTAGGTTVVVRGVNFGSEAYSNDSSVFRRVRTSPRHSIIGDVRDAIRARIGPYEITDIQWTSNSFVNLGMPAGVGKDLVLKICVLEQCSSTERSSNSINTLSYDSPIVTSVSPEEAFAGMQSLNFTISGFNFGTEPDKVELVTVAGETCPIVTLVSPFEILCSNISFANVASSTGRQAVLVTIADNDSPNVQLVTAVGEPIVSAVTPATADPGDTVTISGQNFFVDPGMGEDLSVIPKVAFDGIPAEGCAAAFTDASPNAVLKCRVPHHGQAETPSGFVDIVVTTAGGSVSPPNQIFSYADEGLPAPAPLGLEMASVAPIAADVPREITITWIQTRLKNSRVQTVNQWTLYYSHSREDVEALNVTLNANGAVDTTVLTPDSLTAEVITALPSDIAVDGRRRQLAASQVGRRPAVGPRQGHDPENPHWPEEVVELFNSVNNGSYEVVRYTVTNTFLNSEPYFFRMVSRNAGGSSDYSPVMGPIFDACHTSQYLTTHLALEDVGCDPCPTGAFCGGQPAHRVVNLEGYWRAPWSPVENFVACDEVTACDGYSPSDTSRPAYLFYPQPSAVGGPLARSASLLNEPTDAVLVSLNGTTFAVRTSQTAAEVEAFSAAGGQSFTPVSSAQGTCAAGYGGNLCNRCEVGYARTGTASCGECLGEGVNAVSLIGGAILAVGVIAGVTFMALRSRGEASKLHVSVVKILFTHIQVVAIAASFPLQWPADINRMFIGLNAASSVSDQLISPDCVSDQTSVREDFAGSTFFLRAVVTVVLPFIIFTALALFWYAHWVCGCPYLWEEGEISRIMPCLACLEDKDSVARSRRLRDAQAQAIKDGELPAHHWPTTRAIVQGRGKEPHASAAAPSIRTTSGVQLGVTEDGVLRSAPPSVDPTESATGFSLPNPMLATSQASAEEKSRAGETPRASRLATSRVSVEPSGSEDRPSSVTESVLSGPTTTATRPASAASAASDMPARPKSSLDEYGRLLRRSSMSRVVPLREPNKVKSCGDACNLAKFWDSDHIDLLIVSLTVTAFLIHPTLTRVTLSMFTCSSIADSDERFLVADRGIVCDTPESSPWMYGVGLPFFFLYALGIPGAAFLALWMRRTRLQRDPIVRATYGFLYASFDARYYWWEELTMIRKVLFAIMGVLLTPAGIVTQTTLATLTLTFYAVLHSRASPFNAKLLNRLELTSLIVALLTLQGGLYLFSSGVGRAAKEAVTVLILLINAGFFVHTLWALLEAFAIQAQQGNLDRTDKASTLATLLVGLARSIFSYLCCGDEQRSSEGSRGGGGGGGTATSAGDTSGGGTAPSGGGGNV